jgi:hypothetical protein
LLSVLSLAVCPVSCCPSCLLLSVLSHVHLAQSSFQSLSCPLLSVLSLAVCPVPCCLSCTLLSILSLAVRPVSCCPSSLMSCLSPLIYSVKVTLSKQTMQYTVMVVILKFS